MIRFRRLRRPIIVIGGVKIEHWETALDEDDLFAKLDGDMAEIVMPAKPWYVRLWRRVFPLEFANGQVPDD